MAKENKVEYERVDEKDDKYRRILVKFNPHFSRGSDFEIEFIPILNAVEVGEVFVSEIDSMSMIDLCRWETRNFCLEDGGGVWKRGTILTKDENMRHAKYLVDQWHSGEAEFEPQQIVSCVKGKFVDTVGEFNRPTAYALNCFLYNGELGSLPLVSKEFNVEELRYVIEEISFPSPNADGDMVERPLVRHLFDTHKTEYVKNAILDFLEVTCVAAWDIMKRRTIEGRW